MTHLRTLAVLLVAASAAWPAAAEVSQAWRDARTALSACLRDSEPGARGACLERAATQLDAIEARGEGPLPTPEQARAVRRRDYGLRLPPPPKAPRRAKRASADEPADGVATTLRSASQDGQENWIMTTVEGAVWAQTDKQTLVRQPHPGSAFVARPGAMGSFFCLIDRRYEVRCKRRA